MVKAQSTQTSRNNTISSKLALCLIVKDDTEADILFKALSSCYKFVDKIFLTGTKEPQEKIKRIAEEFDAEWSFFPWIEDFSAARNYNFSRVPKEYEFIFWIDTDDTVVNADKLPGLIKLMAEQKYDICNMVYRYDHDAEGNCVMAHGKGRIIRNDGCVEWYAELHEDFKPNREVSITRNKQIWIKHHSTIEKFKESAKRNLVIAKKYHENHGEDARAFWLLANAHTSIGIDNHEEGIKWWQKFLAISTSQEEKFAGYIRMADSARSLKKLELALDAGLRAMTVHPWFPDAYYSLAETFFAWGKYKHALEMVFIGSRQQKPDEDGLAVNPFDYELKPAKLLFEIYKITGDVVKAKMALEMVQKIAPTRVNKELIDHLNKEITRYEHVEEIYEQAKNKTKKELWGLLESLDEDLKTHPLILKLKNENFAKENSSGKDVAIYCAYTSFEWNPQIAAATGVGGSEEAVIHLARRWVRAGWNVTVYCNSGSTSAQQYDGVTYQPFWSFNARDKFDVLILWRHPKLVDYDLNAEKIYIDLHDVMPEGEFTQERLKKVNKIFVKSQAHRDLFPNIPDDKFVVIPNGIEPQQFEESVEKDPYLLLNTSSADRSLPALLDIFEEVLNRLPKELKKKVKLEWHYGWTVFDNDFKDDQVMQEFKATCVKRLEILKNKGHFVGGDKLNHRDIAKAYQRAGAFLYPTRFYEIHCISAIKAQLGQAVPITTDFAALEESVQFGIKIPVAKASEKSWQVPRGKDFGIKEETDREAFIQAVVTYLKNPQAWVEERDKMAKWVRGKYDWDLISDTWLRIFTE